MKLQKMLGFNHMEFWRKLGPFACSNSSEIFWNLMKFLCCCWFFKLDVEFFKDDYLTEQECYVVIDDKRWSILPTKRSLEKSKWDFVPNSGKLRKQPDKCPEKSGFQSWTSYTCLLVKQTNRPYFQWRTWVLTKLVSV